MEFIIKPLGGLCNKIRVVFSFVVRTRLNNRNLIVVWDYDKDCNGLFLDYFEPIKGVSFVIQTDKKIDYEGCYANKSYDRKLYIESLRELKPNLRIQKEINKMINRELTPNYNAVHIRRTDHVKLATDKGKYTSDQEFIDFILKNNDVKIYLATDNRETQRYFIKLPNTIYHKPIQDKKDKRQTSLEEAVIDLFICVKAKKFKGTYCSSFTELIDILRSFQ